MTVIRLACLLGLVALAILVWMLLDFDGATAIWWSFLGMPTLAVALGLWALDGWRRGSFGPWRDSDTP